MASVREPRAAPKPQPSDAPDPPPRVTPKPPLRDRPILGDDQRAAFEELNAQQPLLLLPVRLETRFRGRELLVRVYPDQVHVDEHQPQLSADEQSAGRAFWERHLAAPAGADAERRAAADALLEQVPGRRAGWVARRTRPTQASDGSLRFPALAPRTSSTPAVAACLPRRWAVVGQIGGECVFVKFGAEVPDRLALGPSFAASGAGPASAAPSADARFAWMVDYAEAVRVGMGVSVPLDEALYHRVASAGLDLFVIGVRGDAPAKGAHALGALLEAHAFTDGLEFIPQGTPTNNGDATRSTWSEEPADPRALLQSELEPAVPRPSATSNAGRLSRALGLAPDGALGRAPQASDDEETGMRAMNVALWPVSWGRYLDDLLAPDGAASILPPRAIERARSLFIEHVRGGASLPTLGIGPQPYGVLPVRLESLDGGDALERVLTSVEQRWRDAVARVPRLDPVIEGALAPPTRENAVAVLGALPHPARFAVRRLGFTPNDDQTAMPHWGGNDQALLDAWVRGYTDELRQVDDIAGQRALIERWRGDIRGLPPIVHDIAHMTVDSIANGLELHLQRQRPLQQLAAEYYDSVYAPTRAPGPPQKSRRHPKIIWSTYTYANIDDSPGSPEREQLVWNRPLVERGSAPAGHRAADYLASLARRVVREAPADDLPQAFHREEPLLYQLLDAVLADVRKGPDAAEYRRALDTLARLAETDVPRLALRFRETLGLASHRLDAWFGALALERLAALRPVEAAAPGAAAGLQLGAFGWVLRLKPDARGARESQGYIHAPSLNHAVTAAVLRSGWNAHGSDAPDSLLAVNLRSDRVRLAAWLLDGVRQGQPLGDLLGQRFERELHEAGAQVYIDGCRRAVLKGENREPLGPVDGLELASAFQGRGVALGGAVLRAGEAPALALGPVWNALDSILRAMDAVADVAAADSMHQLLQGNSERASATLDAITTGAVAPPELQSLETPRPGASITHRVVLLCAANAVVAASLWPAGAPTPAGGDAAADTVRLVALEPALEAWLASMFGDPKHIVCSARWAPTGAPPSPSVGVTFADLKIAAMTALLEAPDGELDAEGDWGRRVIAAALEPGSRLSAAVDPAIPGRVVLDFDGPLADGQVSFREFAEQARALRVAIAKARPLEPGDLALPGGTAPGTLDVADAEARANRLRQAFTQAVTQLENLLPRQAAPRPAAAESALPPAAAAQLRAAMLRFAELGLAGAVPPSGEAASERLVPEARALASRGRKQLRVLAKLQKRWQRADTPAVPAAAVPAAAAAEAAPAAPARRSPEQRLRRARQRWQALIGKMLPLSARATCAAAPSIAAAFAASPPPLDDDPEQASAWLQTLAKVRDKLQGLDDALTLGELSLDRTSARLHVAQFPDRDVWVATRAPADRRRAYLHLCALDHGGVDALAAQAPISGLVFDSWSEQLPAPDAMTGVALHFDAPSSRAPQSWLLVVPRERDRWNFDRVADAVLRALQIARERAVDPDALDAFGHQLPALYAPRRLDAGAQPEVAPA